MDSCTSAIDALLQLEEPVLIPADTVPGGMPGVQVESVAGLDVPE